MSVRTLKLFVVGPHNPTRYQLIRDYIDRIVAKQPNAGSLDVSVITPDLNTRGDRFNDWIFAQIDTCDLLVADLTGFNPNVVYEVAFAHSLGVPCAYLRFSAGSKDVVEDIKHYFKFTLIPKVTVAQLKSGKNDDFEKQLEAIFSDGPDSGETILSDYYDGVSPVDAEFVRGLAEGYWRNFLSRVLKLEPSGNHADNFLRILIPDTFERPDADVRRAVWDKFGKREIELSANTLGRPQKLYFASDVEEPFFFDIPTTLLTITKSSKYSKVDRADYFTEEDRDRLTDRMARRFANALWELIRKNRENVEWPLDRFQIVWMSEVVGPWTENEALMNSDPITRPKTF